MTATEALPLNVEEVAGDVFRLPPRYALLSTRIQLRFKRAADLIVAFVALLVLSPVLAALAAAVLLSSGRPVFYRWRVVGRQGRYFTGFKFRTMVPDADKRLAELSLQNEVDGPAFKMKLDPRVTTLGRVLRKFSLDELPQLWSVLKGDMSLVGPRPPLQTEWERFAPWQRRKLAVTPGITGLWQVSGRSDVTNFDDRVRMDIDYIERWSLALDLKILAKTWPTVLLGRGAH